MSLVFKCATQVPLISAPNKRAHVRGLGSFRERGCPSGPVLAPREFPTPPSCPAMAVRYDAVVCRRSVLLLMLLIVATAWCAPYLRQEVASKMPKELQERLRALPGNDVRVHFASVGCWVLLYPSPLRCRHRTPRWRRGCVFVDAIVTCAAMVVSCRQCVVVCARCVRCCLGCDVLVPALPCRGCRAG